MCAELAALAARTAPAPPSAMAAPAVTPPPSAAALLEFVESCARENAQNWSSMHQDLHKGRRTEVDHLNGWIATRALALGIAADENARLAAEVRDAAAQRRS